MTTYQYANDQGITLVATWTLEANDLLAQVDAPLAGSSDLVKFAYNRQAEQTARVDAAGNVINTDYDLAGRLAAKRITSLVSGFDGACLRKVCPRWRNFRGLCRSSLVIGAEGKGTCFQFKQACLGL